MKSLYLSYILDAQTPTYGDRNRFVISRKSSISAGDAANDSAIETTVHIGTHVDMPFHFHDAGETIESFDAAFWRFEGREILFLEIEVPRERLVIKEELSKELERAKEKLGTASEEVRLLIVKTGICHIRGQKRFWESNYGFHPDLSDYLRESFPSLDIFGFDSISVSSFGSRELGREAHRRFLDPSKPILLLEDMDLRYLGGDTALNEIVVAPMRIAGCDGLPCTVIGVLDD